MDWRELMKLMPVVAASIDPRAGEIAVAIELVANAELDRAQIADSSKTREQLIEEYGARWQLGIDKAKELRQMGHETE